MILLRHHIVGRLIAASVLLGVSGWIVSPLVTAHPHATAVQVERVYTVNPVEQAVVSALASAIRSDDARATFIASLQDSLAGLPDGQALLDEMTDSHDISELMDFLRAMLLRVAGPSTAAVIQSTVTNAGPVISSGDFRASEPVKSVLRDVPTEAALMFFTSVMDVSISDLVRTISSARPLGP